MCIIIHLPKSPIPQGDISGCFPLTSQHLYKDGQLFKMYVYLYGIFPYLYTYVRFWSDNIVYIYVATSSIIPSEKRKTKLEMPFLTIYYG